MSQRDHWWRRTGSRKPGFKYFDANGREISDEAQVERIAGLVIPPAWRDVRICPSPRGSVQAVGTDSAGRLQYIYHPQFVLRRQQRKYGRLVVFGQALPSLRRAANEDIA